MTAWPTAADAADEEEDETAPAAPLEAQFPHLPVGRFLLRRLDLSFTLTPNNAAHVLVRDAAHRAGAEWRAQHRGLRRQQKGAVNDADIRLDVVITGTPAIFGLAILCVAVCGSRMGVGVCIHFGNDGFSLTHIL